LTQATINWQKAKDAGASFAILKATEGTSYVDPVFLLHKQNCAGILPRGSYHYWRVNFDPKAQAAKYASVAKGMELPPCLDVEDWYQDMPKGAELLTKLIIMLREIDNAFGRECMIYTNPNILQYYLPANLPAEITSRRLWVAHYGVSTPVVRPFSKWAFWQYTDKGDAAKYGISEAQSVDLNLYPGTQAEFYAEFGIAPPPVDPPPDGAWLELLSVTGEDGTKIPQVCVVNLSSVDWGPLRLTIDQTPVVTPPPAVADLYRVAAELWPINHGGQEQPGDGGPLTQVASKSTKGGKYTNPLDTLWQNYIKSFNTPKAWDKIKAPDFGPSQGLNDKGKLKWNYLVWPGANVVRVLEIAGGWAKIETITTRNGGQTPDTHPWLFHRVCDNRGNPVLVQGAPIICPLIGAAVWVPMSALVKL
jgi:lysozyme